MIKREVTVLMNSRLETRPVALLVQMASQFDSDIYIECENRRVNAKSIMGMMTLGLDTGMEIAITASGADEEAAVGKLESYLTRNAG